MHPLSLATRFYEPRAAQIGKVLRHFRLTFVENLHKVANADFTVGDQVQQTQTRRVGQSSKQAFERRTQLQVCHVAQYTAYMRLDIYMTRLYSVPEFA